MLERRRPLSQIGWGWKAHYNDSDELDLPSLKVIEGLRNRKQGALGNEDAPPSPLAQALRRLPSLGDKSHLSDGSFSSFSSFSSSVSCSSDEENFEFYSVPPSRFCPRRALGVSGVPMTLLLCMGICVWVFVAHLRWYSPYSSEAVAPSLFGVKKPALFVDPGMFGAPNHDVDALVFVSLGPKAISPAFTWSVWSAIKNGGWGGLVYIITDDPSSTRKVFDSTTEHIGRTSNQNIRIIEPPDNLIGFRADDENTSVTYKARVTKCQLLRILPDELQHVLYIDADIIVGGSLNSFFHDLDVLWRRKKTMPLALFEDCKAFTAGFSAECDTWNTGVMSLRRGSSETCMGLWCEKLSELEGSDQEALDAVIAEGACQGIEALDGRNLRMMKDVFVMLGFISNKTFNHFTQLFRPHKLRLIHRWFYERMLGRRLDTLLPGELIDEESSVAKKHLEDDMFVSGHEEDYL